MSCDCTFGGSKTEHCPEPGCHQSFSCTAAGDKHRTGRHDVTSGPDRRRCLSETEMLAKGMVRNGKGVWMSEARDQEEAA